ncbi:RNA polymerase sigma-70 factor (ECF subfamily) [Kribbella aluminosa]|uniref:RNA polymerase sigma-70 factor (ECF subfamily) n=1 Tax=Kribbella aluminosa TaxID=416017 RepID=A0ABS4UGL6_9ACTN|nr:sigma-70 family RNA polymerase sigma factor [Kribbella aluminosa]MBP2350787.1 RNA polymerase sigma-70 factor (ECF subfamily) [Kribbella aluminosa]
MGNWFEAQVEEHGASIHAYLARRTVSGVADDLLGDVWVAAYSARSSYDPSLGSARAWLFGVARHVLHGYYRKEYRKQRLRVRRLVDRPIDETAAVDARLDAAALGPALRTALRELPAAERELLLLVAWENLTPSDAAQVLGIPAGTARSRLYRARQRMDERLAGSGQTQDERTRQEAER